ncbi:hypothetical protein JHK82_055458 [Glycine max]|nr:hypothetical protein JHK86_055293 [Glycine max]KAG5074096.1 hypothetical protein JHK84_055327 [Glycine max]KAG5076763.1 hypothetical protein JHK82_055458 [Glycine max]
MNSVLTCIVDEQCVCRIPDAHSGVNSKKVLGCGWAFGEEQRWSARRREISECLTHIFIILLSGLLLHAKWPPSQLQQYSRPLLSLPARRRFGFGFGSFLSPTAKPKRPSITTTLVVAVDPSVSVNPNPNPNQLVLPSIESSERLHRIRHTLM